MAWRLSSSAWLCWHSLWLWAAFCSWLWVRARWSSSSLRREASSLHFAPCSFNCPSRRRFCFSKPTSWASRPAAVDLAWWSSSIAWLGVKGEGGIVSIHTKDVYLKDLVNQKHIINRHGKETSLRNGMSHTSLYGCVQRFHSPACHTSVRDLPLTWRTPEDSPSVCFHSQLPKGKKLVNHSLNIHQFKFYLKYMHTQTIAWINKLTFSYLADMVAL